MWKYCYIVICNTICKSKMFCVVKWSNMLYLKMHASWEREGENLYLFSDEINPAKEQVCFYSIVKILNLNIMLSCTNLYHFFPVSSHSLHSLLVTIICTKYFLMTLRINQPSDTAHTCHYTDPAGAIFMSIFN